MSASASSWLVFADKLREERQRRGPRTSPAPPFGSSLSPRPRSVLERRPGP